MMLCALPLALALGLCPDETISGYAAPGAVWHLTELDGAEFDAEATLTFPAEGVVRGQAPCNAFTATQALPIPWIEIRDIAATRTACPDLSEEERFFDALRAMTLVEVTRDVLLLSAPGGGEMVFRTSGD